MLVAPHPVLVVVPRDADSASPSGPPARTSARPSSPASRSARINVATYGLSGLFAAAAALYLTTQTGAGSPTIGKDYILPSVAAAVIGGVSLFGGRGHLLGTLIGAFILTLIGNLVFVLQRLELLAAGRLRRHPARRGARQLARRESSARGRTPNDRLPRPQPADPARLCRDGRAPSGDRAVLAGLPVGLQPALDRWCWPPSSASSRSARPSSSSAAASTSRCPGC